MVPSLVFYVLGDCVLLSWDLLHSTVQYKKDLFLTDFVRPCQLTYPHFVRPALSQFWWVEGGWPGGWTWHVKLVRQSGRTLIQLWQCCVYCCLPLYIQNITLNAICVCFFRSDSVGGRSAWGFVRPHFGVWLVYFVCCRVIQTWRGQNEMSKTPLCSEICYKHSLRCDA